MEGSIEDESTALWQADTQGALSEEANNHKPERFSPGVAILGVPFDPVTIADALDCIDGMIASGRPHYIATANVDFLVQAGKDMELRRVLMDADLVLCDGTPVVWLSRLLGNRLPERVAGSDLVPELIAHAAAKGYRLFFLGGASEVTAKAVKILQGNYPKLQIQGHYSPPFQPLLEMDHENIARRIRAVEPDIVLVSFGCPKAEKWMAMNFHALGIPVMMGVGGTIDFLAGEKKRAPDWMRRSGTEWLFRLLQEPKRLARRYADDFCQFIPGAIGHCLRFGRPCVMRSSPHRISMSMNEPKWVRMQTPERLNYQVINRDSEVWRNLLAQHCLLELKDVRYIDSTGLGWLARLQQRLGRNGCHLVLLDPSPAVQRALATMGWENLFLQASDTLEARQLIKDHAHRATFETKSHSPASAVPTWRCRGEISARNANSVWEELERRVLSGQPPHQHLILDFSEVPFIDSGGVQLLHRVKTILARRGADFKIISLQPSVRETLRQANAEQLFTFLQP